jgi:hypothetical protein
MYIYLFIYLFVNVLPDIAAHQVANAIKGRSPRLLRQQLPPLRYFISVVLAYSIFL